MKNKNIKNLIRDLLSRKESIANRDVASSAGITAPAVHRHLRAMVATDELVAEGQGRGVRYRLKDGQIWRLEHRLDGLEEDRVWQAHLQVVEPLGGLGEQDQTLVQYAFLELVNNAIEHSAGRRVKITWRQRPQELWFEVADDGRGVFSHIRASLELPDELTALQELSKGKLTTAPSGHSGEGIFFVSKSADRFELAGGGLVWLVDNLRGDMAVERVDPPQPGTRASFALRLPAARSLEEVFAAFTRDYRFQRSRVVVGLFEIGQRFMSRSEARRLLRGLERFEEVVLDFRGVRSVGQGFVDEVFRVWAATHPQVQLLPEHMDSAVEFMVRRGLPAVRPDSNGGRVR